MLRRSFRRHDKLWRAIAAILLGLSFVLVPQLSATSHLGLARGYGLETFPLIDHATEINGFRFFEIDAFQILGSMALVCWLVSLLVYWSIQRQLKRPIQLDPKGQSRIKVYTDAWLYLEVFTKAGLLGFFLSVAFFLSIILLNLNIAAMAIAINLGISAIQAIISSMKLVIGSWEISVQEYGVNSLAALFTTILKFALYATIPLLFVWSFSQSSVFLTRMWGPGINLILFFTLAASLSNAWWTAMLTNTWIQKNRKFVCNTCKTPLLPVETPDVNEHLNEAQRVAKDLSSTQFKGWNCPSCTRHSSEFHLQSCVINPWMFDCCPNCQEFTVTKTLSTLGPSLSSNRKIQQTTYNCQVCGYSKEDHRINP